MTQCSEECSTVQRHEKELAGNGRKGIKDKIVEHDVKIEKIEESIKSAPTKLHNTGFELKGEN